MAIRAEDLRRYAGQAVRVRLRDGIVVCGQLRTALLTPHALSVFVITADGGATVYIDQIDDVWVIEPKTEMR